MCHKIGNGWAPTVQHTKPYFHSYEATTNDMLPTTNVTSKDSKIIAKLINVSSTTTVPTTITTSTQRAPTTKTTTKGRKYVDSKVMI